MSDLLKKLPTPPGTGYYLVGNGKLFGPYTKTEFSFLFRKGVLTRFQYFWDLESLKWRPVAALKARPLPEREPDEPTLTEAQEKAWEEELSQKSVNPPPPPEETPGPSTQETETKSRGVPTIAYSQVKVCAGELQDVSNKDCVLWSGDPDLLPPFREGESIVLNLLRPKDDSTIEADVEVLSVSGQPNDWVFELKWLEFPEAFFKGKGK